MTPRIVWPCTHCGVDWVYHGGLDHEYERDIGWISCP